MPILTCYIVPILESLYFAIFNQYYQEIFEHSTDILVSRNNCNFHCHIIVKGYFGIPLPIFSE